MTLKKCLIKKCGKAISQEAILYLPYVKPSRHEASERVTNKRHEDNDYFLIS
jgi:hypothetical protein